MAVGLQTASKWERERERNTEIEAEGKIIIKNSHINLVLLVVTM